MNIPRRSILSLALAALAASCSGSGVPSARAAGTARVTLGEASYDVRQVEMTIEPGDDAWFRIEGEPASGPDEDCVVGLSAGLGLYGDLPASVRKPLDLVGQRLRIDFTGDGDDANFCFVGMGGLAGAEEAWVTIDAVRGDLVTFTMSGTFKVYDENGEGPVRSVTARGSAVLRGES